ncbi:uncharacterized protein HD556DRAFT_1311521 [Suillus plorans]|uniref:Uncharacterized protein n=1 Tax=Suillus plorans TaxID=116603 RepID=A0A9P7DED9_9AGAM|nr:uncharacterized protein HD556DRAFT_1311521 [Suillus plorans]KAG1789138.1 hypothetical protein HD556DRAFT_1311521 [Suillus plorans]
MQIIILHNSINLNHTAYLRFPFTRPCFSPASKVKHIVLEPGHSGSIPRSLYLDLGVKFSFQYFHIQSSSTFVVSRHAIVNYIGDFPNLAPEGVCPSALVLERGGGLYITNWVGHFTTCGLVLNGGTELQADAVTPDTGYRVGPLFGLDDEGGQRGVWKHSGHEGL